MSIWQHKGFDIALEGSQFATTINNRRVRSSSLEAAKKAINKHLDAKAVEVALNLPIVMVTQREGVVEIKRGVITGVDANTLDVVGQNIDSIRGYGRSIPMPDSEESVKVYREYVEAEKALALAKDALHARIINVRLGAFGRSKRTYGEAVQLLQQNYKSACKP